MNLKKVLSLLLIFGLLILAGVGYWIYSLRSVSTDDAYLNANTVQIAARVTGQVIALEVQNNQAVKQGQVLFRLDPEPFTVRINELKAQLEIDQANLINAQLTSKRTFALVEQGVLAKQAQDDMVAKLASAQGQVALDQATLQNAALNLHYTTITAPTDGWVSNMSLRPHDVITANAPQFALITQNEFWVDANFKETDLEKIKMGAPATIKVDMYPDHTFKGEVESISAGSGNAFALLPPQNATGNWVKVTQRVPVRVRILDSSDAAQFPLRVGTSATVTIPTASASS